MRAVILAAGEGRRLRPLTEHAPKPMLAVAGKPLLERNVSLLARYGFTDIVINTHYRARSIEDHFGDGSAFGVRVRYSREAELLGTAGALNPLRDLLTGTFLVLYGDILTNCNLRGLLEVHRTKSATITLAVFRRENATAAGIVAIDSGDRVERFLEKPQPDEVFSSWVNAGIMVCEPRVFDAIPPGFSDFGRNVLPELIRRGDRVFAYRMDGENERLLWIDSPEDYERTKAAVRQWI